MAAFAKANGINLTGVVAVEARRCVAPTSAVSAKHAAAYGQRLCGGSAHGAGAAQGSRPQRGQRRVGSAGDAVARRLHRHRRCAALQSPVAPRRCSSAVATTCWRSRKTSGLCSMPSSRELCPRRQAQRRQASSRPPTIATKRAGATVIRDTSVAAVQPLSGRRCLGRVTSRRQSAVAIAPSKPVVRYYLLSKYMPAKRAADRAQSLGHREPVALGARRRCSTRMAIERKDNAPGEPRDPAQARRSIFFAAIPDAYPCAKSQTRRLGRCLPARLLSHMR